MSVTGKSQKKVTLNSVGSLYDISALAKYRKFWNSA